MPAASSAPVLQPVAPRATEGRRRAPLASDLVGARGRVPMAEVGGDSYDDTLVDVMVEKVTLRNGQPLLHLKVLDEACAPRRLVPMAKADYVFFQSQLQST